MRFFISMVLLIGTTAAGALPAGSQATKLTSREMQDLKKKAHEMTANGAFGPATVIESLTIPSITRNNAQAKLAEILASQSVEPKRISMETDVRWRSIYRAVNQLSLKPSSSIEARQATRDMRRYFSHVLRKRGGMQLATIERDASFGGLAVVDHPSKEVLLVIVGQSHLLAD